MNNLFNFAYVLHNICMGNELCENRTSCRKIILITMTQPKFPKLHDELHTNSVRGFGTLRELKKTSLT